MGSWKIEISGHGIHHNDRPDDADRMAAEFVTTLRAAGHDIATARLILTNGDGEPAEGGATDITAGAPIVHVAGELLTAEPFAVQLVEQLEADPALALRLRALLGS